MWGSTGVLAVTDAGAGAEALGVLLSHISEFDDACSRFRSDSELTRVNSAPAGRPVPVSPLLLAALQVALRAAAVTGGLVDPTVGTALEVLGYDRDFSAVEGGGPPVRISVHPVCGWKAVRVDPTAGTVARPAGAHLDLGATAKAWCADRAAATIAGKLGTGVLVSLGGDIAVAGPAPPGGWPIQIADDHRQPLDSPAPTVSISSGGLATSSTTVRRWKRGDSDYHHLIDPASGRPAREHWRTVSVAAATCLDANIASCAAILGGPQGATWLEGWGLPARLVHRDGHVVAVGHWPEENGAKHPGQELAPC